MNISQVERHDLVWDMRESDEAGSKLVYEVIQAARANFPAKEKLQKKQPCSMPSLIETENCQYGADSQRNLRILHIRWMIKTKCLDW